MARVASCFFSARVHSKPLKVGDIFDEVISINLLGLITFERETKYRVMASERNILFEVHGTSDLFDLTIHYDFVD